MLLSLIVYIIVFCLYHCMLYMLYCLFGMFTILDYSSALEYSIIRRYTNIVYYYSYTMLHTNSMVVPHVHDDWEDDTQPTELTHRTIDHHSISRVCDDDVNDFRWSISRLIIIIIITKSSIVLISSSTRTCSMRFNCRVQEHVNLKNKLPI